ncbi:hypothetical protein APHMUC_0968 [Anaplasma phagocytophilum str. ApMUC09]|uniref:Uncharacterized protein n=1 Tax=Anaplasma phagocytophilum str. ApMUC09 TaxID=1359152 RepID=A0A0F3NA07_ANAPH|nr:hypothetical protein APHMUC_0968 [Anaplasma phagocytophilum str. ApMUC09]
MCTKLAAYIRNLVQYATKLSRRSSLMYGSKWSRMEGA